MSGTVGTPQGTGQGHLSGCGDRQGTPQGTRWGHTRGQGRDISGLAPSYGKGRIGPDQQDGDGDGDRRQRMKDQDGHEDEDGRKRMKDEDKG